MGCLVTNSEVWNQLQIYISVYSPSNKKISIIVRMNIRWLEQLVSVDFFHFLHNTLDVDTTKNYPALTSHFTNPSFKNAVLLEIPLSSRKSSNVSIVTTATATMFEPAILVHRESGPHCLVTVMLEHISIIFT